MYQSYNTVVTHTAMHVSRILASIVVTQLKTQIANDRNAHSWIFCGRKILLQNFVVDLNEPQSTTIYHI